MIIAAILLVIAGAGAAGDFFYTLCNPEEYGSRVHRALGLVLTALSALFCFGAVAWGVFGGVAL